jgi:putative membrane protein
LKSDEKKGFFYRVLCGFLLGLSIVAPGISGSVIAIMMGIYDKLIGIVANPFKKLKENILYLIPMGIGAVISGVAFIMLFKFLFDNYTTPTYFLFIALIGGCFPSIYKKAKQDKFQTKYAVSFSVALIVALALAIANQYFENGTLLNQILNRTVDEAGLINQSIYYPMFCGFIAGMVSIIPGMSISIVLMILGVYTFLMTAASELNLLIIATVGGSFGLGMILFSKVVKFVFDQYKPIAYNLVFGFMVGSIFGILPALPKSAGGWALSISMFIAGAFLSILLLYAGKKLNVED